MPNYLEKAKARHKNDWQIPFQGKTAIKNWVSLKWRISKVLWKIINLEWET